MKANNSIEINGKRYDARTGEILNAPAKKAAPRVRSVDGISAAPAIKHSAPAVHHAKRANRSAATHIKRRVHHSTTLHRRAVHAPKVEVEKTVAEPKKAEVMPKVDSKRLERAQGVARSHHISRFGTATLPVAEPPQISDEPQVSPPAPEQEPEPVKEQQNVSQLKPSTIHKAASYAAQANEKENRVHLPSHSRTKLFSYAASGLVVLLLAGYVAYLNVPSLSMKVAASRAGFAATMPGQTPSGYSLRGPVVSSPGQVTLNYGSNTDARQFSVKQQPTTWDSTALLENYVIDKDKDYLTYQDRGLTVYIYNEGNAAWVNGGKMYTLDGTKTELDTRQILNLATSM